MRHGYLNIGAATLFPKIQVRDLGAVSAWLQTFKEKDLYRYCVDMVTLVMLCSEAYETIPEGCHRPWYIGGNISR